MSRTSVIKIEIDETSGTFWPRGCFVHQLLMSGKFFLLAQKLQTPVPPRRLRQRAKRGADSAFAAARATICWHIDQA